jgi:hypothetical protein
MAYTTINKSSDYFNTVTYTGTGSSNSITGVGFQPDWVWGKQRSGTNSHELYDAVRGVNKIIYSDLSDAEGTNSNGVSAFNADGFTVAGNTSINASGQTVVAWNWKAGGTAPAITYTVKVVSDSGNKYRFNDFGTSAVTLDLQEGGVYTFDQSDSSNSGHPLRFSTTSNGTHGGGTEYTTGVVVTGTPGNAGAKTVITVAASAPTLYYYCTQHSGMGGQANTNSTFGSSNFSGSIQTTVSANTTAGFSISKYTGNATSGATIGHGLGVTPKMIIIKGLETTYNWIVGHNSLSTNWTNYLTLSTTDASSAATNIFNDTAPTSSVFSIGNALGVNTNNSDYIAYCFAEKTGYSKFGSYTGNGDSDGTFVYTGFKPAWIINKRIDSSTGGSWILQDNKRGNNVRNPVDLSLSPTNNQTESDWGDTFDCDYLSNGFKWRMNGSGGYNNTSGATYIYMAFAEAPLVGSNNIPCTAR